jgi:spore coat protein U-like protein
VGIGLAGIGWGSLLPSSASAATATTTFLVTATVQATCSILANPLVFGIYTRTELRMTTTISVTCTNTTPYNVGLNAGSAAGATVTTRQMTGSTNGGLLSYSLFSNSTYSVNWGTTVGTDTVSGTGNGEAQTLTVYGDLLAGQNVAPDTYADTITATITY